MLLEQGLPTEDVDALTIKIIEKRRVNEMEKHIIDEQTGWEYELKGEQYYPTGRVMRDGRLQPETVDEDNGPEKEIFIGVWGQRHLRYIREHNKRLYFDLFVSGRLSSYLAEIEAQAEDMFFRVVEEISAREGVTETLKLNNQMAWVQSSNNIYEQAMEIVNHELIYT